MKYPDFPRDFYNKGVVRVYLYSMYVLGKKEGGVQDIKDV